jgi:hypothetical protein
MNRADVLMLNNSLDELGNTFLRNRQLDQEKQFREGETKTQQMRTQADIDFRKAQGEHYSAMETKQSEHDAITETQNAQRNELLEKQVGLKQSAQDLAEAQASLKDSMATLAHQVKAGKMNPELATQYFRDSMDNGIGKSNPQLHEQMLAQPQYKAMYDGKIDWSTLADQLAQPTKGGQAGKVDLQIQHWRQAQDAADNAADPAEKEQNQKYADILKLNLPSSLKTTPPAGYTDTKIVQKPNPLGVGAPTTLTNTTTRAYSPSAVAPGAAATQPATAPAAAAGDVPIAPPDPTQRVKGQKYRSQKNPNLIATWTGAGWDTNTNAPAQAVPGFGAAKP